LTTTGLVCENKFKKFLDNFKQEWNGTGVEVLEPVKKKW